MIDDDSSIRKSVLDIEELVLVWFSFTSQRKIDDQTRTLNNWLFIHGRKQKETQPYAPINKLVIGLCVPNTGWRTRNAQRIKRYSLDS